MMQSAPPLNERLSYPEQRNSFKMSAKSLGSSQYNIGNREPLFVLGGSAVYILIPWKPVVLVWGLLSGMILVSFVASSLLEGKNPFAPGANITQPIVKTGVAQAGQSKHSQKAAQAPT